MANTIINVVVATPKKINVSTNSASILQTTAPVTLKNTPVIPNVRNLDDLKDVTIVTPANNNVLAYENGEWINSNIATSGAANAYSNAILFSSNASNINTGTLSIALFPNLIDLGGAT